MSNLLFTPYEVILDNDYATLVCYPQQKIVHHRFHRPVTSQEYRSVLEAGVGALGKYGATKWLSDDRSFHALSDEDRAWSQTEWRPRAAAAGWKFWALVVPPELKERMAFLEVVDDNYERGVWISVFTDPEDAKQWLEQR